MSNWSKDLFFGKRGGFSYGYFSARIASGCEYIDAAVDGVRIGFGHHTRSASRSDGYDGHRIDYAVSGASIPAILLGIPGNPNAIATVEDGILMTKKGKADQALGGAVVASLIGGMGSLLCLVLFAPLIARLTLAFGPAEKTTLALVGLVIIASVSANNVMKGLLMGAFGMSLAFLGTDPFSG